VQEEKRMASIRRVRAYAFLLITDRYPPFSLEP
jgi:hypothetical protein